MQDLYSAIINKGRKMHYAKGEILFFEGEKAQNLLLLTKGKVRIYKIKETQNDYNQCTIHILNATQFIAEMPFFMRLPYPANAECMQECEIVSLSFDTFYKALNDRQLCLSFITSLCEKICILESHISTQNKNLQDKLLEYLLLHKENLHQLKQKHIAQSLNITPQSLSRTIKALKIQGVINTNKGKITFLDS